MYEEETSKYVGWDRYGKRMEKVGIKRNVKMCNEKWLKKTGFEKMEIKEKDWKMKDEEKLAENTYFIRIGDVSKWRIINPKKINDS